MSEATAMIRGLSTRPRFPSSEAWSGRVRALFSQLLMAASMLAACGAQIAAAEWEPIGPQGATVWALARQPGSGAVVMAGTYFGGIYRSTNGGDTWTAVDAPFKNNAVVEISYDTSDPNTIYVAVFSGGIYKSVDGGATWASRNAGLTNLQVRRIAIDPFAGNHVVAATAEGFFGSLDGGANFARLAGFPDAVLANAVEFDSRRNGTIHLAMAGRGVLATADGGTTWTDYNEGLTSLDIKLIRRDAASDTLYALAADGTMSARAAGASAWSRLTDKGLPQGTVHDLALHPQRSGVVVIGHDAGVFELSRTPFDESWRQLTPFGASLVLLDPATDTMFAAFPHGSLWRSLDGGATWSRADSGMQNLFVGAFALTSEGSTRLIHAGSDLGIFTSRDNGATWSQSSNLVNIVMDVSAAPGTSGRLYAGMERVGVWTSDDRGAAWTQISTGIAPVRMFAIDQSAVEPKRAVVATSAGAYASDDGGTTWRMILLPEMGYALSAVMDPVFAPVCYVGGPGGQVYRSLDGCRSFQLLKQGLPGSAIVALRVGAWDKPWAIDADGGLYGLAQNEGTWFPAKSGVPEPALTLEIDPRRPWVLYLGTNGGGVYKSESGGIQWTQMTSGLDVPFVFSLWIDRVDANVVYAGTVDRIFKSIDGGAHWTDASAGLPAGVISGVVGDASSPSQLYAVVRGRGIYRSSDAGASWQPVDQLPAENMVALTASGIQGGRLLAGSDGYGAFLSTDKGTTWTRSSAGMHPFVRSVLAHPLAPSTLYAGALQGGVYRSDDGGENWRMVGARDELIFRLALDPSDVQTLYAATATGIAVSRDGGQQWAQLMQQAAFVYSLAVDPADSQSVIIGSNAGQVFASDDGGKSWRRAGQGLAPLTTLALAHLQTPPAILAAPERAGIWESVDAGRSWTKVSSPDMDTVQVRGLTVDPRSGFVYAATNGLGVLISLDRGRHWTPLGAGASGSIIAQVAVSATTHWRVWSATLDDGVHASSNAGLEWTRASNGLPDAVTAIATSNDETLLAGTANGVFRSADGGQSWDRSSGLEGISITALWISADDVAVAGTANSGLHRSVDGGRSWQPVGSAAVRTLAIASVVGGHDRATVYAASFGGGLLRSVDAGATWTDPIVPGIVQRSVLLVLLHPDKNVIYGATGGSGVIKSEDGGATWKIASAGLDSPYALVVAADPRDRNVLFAGTVDGVFVSRDAAASWTRLGERMRGRIITALAMDPITDTLYAGTEGGGVHRFLHPQ